MIISIVLYVGSCVSQIRMFFKVTEKVDNGKVLLVIDMVFNKDFDKVLHGRVPWKCKSHCILGELAN